MSVLKIYIKKIFSKITNFFKEKNRQEITVEVSEIIARKKASDQNIQIEQP